MMMMENFDQFGAAGTRHWNVNASKVEPRSDAALKHFEWPLASRTLQFDSTPIHHQTLVTKKKRDRNKVTNCFRAEDSNKWNTGHRY